MERIDEKSKAKRLIELLSAKEISLCSCESFTGGLFAATLTSVPGASAAFAGAMVTYFTEEKVRIAHIPEQLIEEFGVISPECARAMAENVRVLMGCDLGVSFTGNAGPSAMEGKPAGLVYMALADGTECEVFEIHLHKERNELRKEAVDLMISALIESLQKQE